MTYLNNLNVLYECDLCGKKYHGHAFNMVTQEKVNFIFKRFHKQEDKDCLAQLLHYSICDNCDDKLMTTDIRTVLFEAKLVIL